MPCPRQRERDDGRLAKSQTGTRRSASEPSKPSLICSQGHMAQSARSVAFASFRSRPPIDQVEPRRHEGSIPVAASGGLMYYCHGRRTIPLNACSLRMGQPNSRRRAVDHRAGAFPEAPMSPYRPALASLPCCGLAKAWALAMREDGDASAAEAGARLAGRNGGRRRGGTK